MLTNDVIRFAGDVSIGKAEIISLSGVYTDIRQQIINIQIYEDLFNPFISGMLIVRESIDLMNALPLVGEEQLSLEITTPTLTTNFKGQFYIYKISEREILGDKTVAYKIHFISKEALTDLNKKIGRGFGGKVSEIVTSILTDKNIGLETLKSVIVEPSVNNTKYVSNFWSPIKNINYLAERAVNTNGSPSFIFFENRDGFNFISLETLYKPEVLQTFIDDKYSRDTLSGVGSIKNIEEDYKRIQEIRIPVAFDYFDRVSSGMFSSAMIGYDLTKKQYSVKVYDMFNGYSKQKHLNEYANSSDKVTRRADALIIKQPKYYANFSGFGDVTNSATLQKRLSLLKQAESQKIEIIVPGRFDYTVGKKVRIKLNRIEPISEKDTDLEDKLFSGVYLISAINHYVNHDKHECNIELIKDSVIKQLQGR